MEAQRINYDYDVSVACLLARRVVQYVLKPVLYPKSAFKVNFYYIIFII